MGNHHRYFEWYYHWPIRPSLPLKWMSQNATRGPTLRHVLPRGEYDRRYRQGSCVLCRMSLWAERCRLLPHYFGRCSSRLCHCATRVLNSVDWLAGLVVYTNTVLRETLNSTVMTENRIIVIIRRHRWKRFRPFLSVVPFRGLSVCLSVSHVRALCSNGRIYRHDFLHMTVQCPLHFALKFGLHLPTPSSPNCAQKRPVDLSVGDIRWQITAE